MIKYSTCRKDEGGKPKCTLGKVVKPLNALTWITAPYGNSAQEVRGNSLRAMQMSWDTGEVCYEKANRVYNVVVIKASPTTRSGNAGIEIDVGDHISELLNLSYKADIDNSKVYVTSATRCVQPQKGTLRVEWLKACIPHLQCDLERIKPKVVILLGNKPLRLFGLHNKGGIHNIRGQIFTLPIFESDSLDKYTVIPTLDPAAVVMSEDPMVQARVLEDFRKVKSLLDGKKVDTSPHFASYTVIDSVNKLKDALKEIKREGLLTFDTESRKVPWHTQPLLCISMAWKDNNVIVPMYSHSLKEDPEVWQIKPYWKPHDLKDVIAALKDAFEDEDLPKAAHNIKYDINVLRKHLGIRVKGFLFDTMLMHHILHEQRPHDLNFLAAIELGGGNYSHKVHAITGTGKELKKTYDWVPDDILWEYAATDVECTYRLKQLYHRRMQKKNNLWMLYCSETEKTIRPLAKAEWFGHKIDTKLINTIGREYETEAQDLLVKIRKDTHPDFNPSSPDQLSAALISMGYKEKIRDDSKVKGYTTAEAVLTTIRDDLPLVDNVLKYRKTQKILGTYVERVKKDVDRHDRLRYSWKQHGTESGRLSCQFFHQLPRINKKRKHNIRDALIIQSGYKLVYLDYNQIELRVLAYLADDTEMLRIFADSSADIHRATASTLLNIPVENVSDFNRQNCGKNVNFGLAYGSQGNNLIKTGKWEDDAGQIHPITWAMLERGMERFQDRFHGVTKYLRDLPDKVRSSNCVLTTPFGRERRIGKKLNATKQGVRKAAEREIVNCSIQSPAGAITIRSLYLIDDQIEKFISKGDLKEDDIFLVNTVHDSGAWEVKDGLVDWFCSALKTVAERPIKELGNLSFPCAIGVGNSASEAEANSK